MHLSLLLVTGERRCKRRTFQMIQNFIVILQQLFISKHCLGFFLWSFLNQSTFQLLGAKSFYSTNQGLDDAVPVLLVDGYNVCGYWMKLKKHFMKGRLDIARQKLIDELVNFSMLRGLYFASSVTCLKLWLYQFPIKPLGRPEWNAYKYFVYVLLLITPWNSLHDHDA